MKYVLGIDVGGTKIAAGLVDQAYSVSNLAIVPTSQTDLAGQLIDLIGSYQNFFGIGLALPGQILPSGLVTRLPNIKNFKPTNLQKFLENKFRVPVTVINDAKAFAYAEAMIGQAQNNKVVAGVILGTGIGVGIVIGKQIYFGKDGVAGELEHIEMLDGIMFRQRWHQAGKFENAAEAKQYLRTLFDMVIFSFNPDIILLGGGWSNIPDMEELANTLTTNPGDYESETPVKISTLKYPGLIGAALLAGLK
jgi:predicted NBD/HSP70 family sugar kinase